MAKLPTVHRVAYLRPGAVLINRRRFRWCTWLDQRHPLPRVWPRPTGRVMISCIQCTAPGPGTIATYSINEKRNRKRHRASPFYPRLEDALDAHLRPGVEISQGRACCVRARGSSARLVTALQANHAPTRGRHAGSDSRSSDSSGRARGAPPWALPSSPLSCGHKRVVL